MNIHSFVEALFQEDGIFDLGYRINQICRILNNCEEESLTMYFLPELKRLYKNCKIFTALYKLEKRSIFRCNLSSCSYDILQCR